MITEALGDDAALREVRQTRFLINRVDDWIMDEVRPYIGNRILEVGCGWGNLTERFSVGKDLWYAIDKDPQSIESLQARIPYPNVKAQCLDICEASFEHFGEYFDTVISLNVLEHIADDLLALQKMREVLAPYGRLILIVPAHQKLYGTMDRAIGHYRRYTMGDLKVKLLIAGFMPIRMWHINAMGALGWFLAGKILRRHTPPRNQLIVFNAFVPCIRRIEAVLRPHFGISLLTIAQ